MRGFLIKLTIFAIPIMVLFAFSTAIFIFSKEILFDLDPLIKSKEKYLIGYAYDEQNYDYLKWADLNFNERKDLWVLGSSRVLPFRKYMFDVSFYNVGYTITGMTDFLPFMESIPKNKYPKYVIIGLDQWLFNISDEDSGKSPPIDKWEKNFSFYPQKYQYISFYGDFVRGKYKSIFHELANSSGKIGLNAIVNNKGFRNDGSMFYGNQIDKLLNNDSTANDFEYADTLDRIENARGPFEYGNTLHEKVLSNLDKILAFYKEDDIQVVAFLPPFADEVYTKMESSGKYGYLKEIYPKIKPIFDKYGYEIYDFPSVSSVGSSDNETLDGFHGGEVTYQRLLIKILNSGSILNQIANVRGLNIDLSNRKNNYLIYDY